MRNAIFSLLLAVISRVLILIDHRSGAFKRALGPLQIRTAAPHHPSGRRRLSSVYVSAGQDAPTALICHGIGEIAEYWGRGAGSAAVHGRLFSGLQLLRLRQQHRHSLRRPLRRRRNRSLRKLSVEAAHPIFLLGFSLGTGVAGSVASRLPVEGLILCEGFSSLRDAAVAIGFPRWMTHVMPDIWRTAIESANSSSRSSSCTAIKTICSHQRWPNRSQMLLVNEDS